MSETANSRRAGLYARPPVAEHGLHRPICVTSFRGGATPRRSQAVAIALGLALTLGLLLCGGAASAGESPIAIVVLGPRFVSGGGDEATSAAELACDRLARELGKNASLRVVDRAQLDRILKERRLGQGPAGTILSYDLMVRLEVDAVRPVPRAILKLVDLSDGNLLADMLFAWSVPLPDGAIRNMAGTCQAAARRLAGPGEKALRVRLLEVDNPGKSTRLEPLAIRLRDAVAGALARSEGVRPVHHLEALTAKEESLLLTLGLSKLPGGRQFTPQSDATIELRIRELDGVGKTFEQTRVEIGWRIRKGETYSGEWASADAAVKDFDGLLKTAWARSAESLGRASPRAAGDYLDEMALRRKQAQAELDAAQAMRASRGHVTDPVARAARLAAAVKIDPTFEEAAYHYAIAVLNRGWSSYDPKLEKSPDTSDSVLEALRYLQRYPQNSRRRKEVYQSAFCTAWAGLQAASGTSMSSSKNELATLDALKQIVDLAIIAQPLEDYSYFADSVRLCYEAMWTAGVGSDSRQQWLLNALAERRGKLKAAERLEPFFRNSYVYGCVRLSRFAMMLSCGERRLDDARGVAVGLEALATAYPREFREQTQDLRKEVARLNDDALLARFDGWASATKPVGFVVMDWPRLSPIPVNRFAPLDPDHAGFEKVQQVPAAPLVAVGKNMFVLVNRWNTVTWEHIWGNSGESPQRIACLPLDDEQAPAGRLEFVPEPKTRQDLRVLSAASLGGRLYLGTHGSGILAYDPSTNAWQVYGVEHGVPEWIIQSVHVMDEDKLLCAGGVSERRGVIFTLNVKNGEVVILQRVSDDEEKGYCFRAVDFFWIDGKMLRGMNRWGRFVQDITDTATPMQKWPKPGAWGWRERGYVDPTPTSFASIGSRRFIMSTDGLREIDAAGKVLNAWAVAHQIAFRQTLGGVYDGMDTITIACDLPSSQPAPRFIVQDETHLFIPEGGTCYDPAKDTWYGPLKMNLGGSYAISGKGGFWSGGNGTVAFIRTADFIATAKRAGLVMTTEQFRAKRQEALNAMKPLDQAKWALSMRQWDKSRGLCGSVLENDAGDVQALLVMGLVHEPYCLNQPDKAIEYYGKLATMDDNPSAAFTGLVHQYRLQIEAKRYAEALRIGRLIEREYPRNSMGETLGEHNRWLEKQVSPKKEAGK